jgi:hypothetical protein
LFERAPANETVRQSIVAGRLDARPEDAQPFNVRGVQRHTDKNDEVQTRMAQRKRYDNVTRMLERGSAHSSSSASLHSGNVGGGGDDSFSGGDGDGGGDAHTPVSAEVARAQALRRAAQRRAREQAARLERQRIADEKLRESFQVELARKEEGDRRLG